MNGTKQITKVKKHWAWDPLRIIPIALGKIINFGNSVTHGAEIRLEEIARPIAGARVVLGHGETTLTIDRSSVSPEQLQALLSAAADVSHALDFSLRNATSDVIPLVADLRGIEWLDLADSVISDVDLLHLKNLKRLGQLDLSKTQITDDGLLSLATLHSLETIDLSGTMITDDGLIHLLGLPQLESIWVLNTGVTQPAVDEFTRAVSREVEFHV